ncbi:hypothetical protein CRH03_22190 [Clostridium sp. HMb25]|nr:hypothetical protein CRH03_22190 [Clostridium sp. HMb25]
MSKAKDIFKTVMDYYYILPFKVGRKINPKFNNEIASVICSQYQKISHCFTTLKCRPIEAIQLTLLNFQVDTKKKIAIILQGPPDYKDNFTFETIKMYRKLFPESVLILSTWKNVSNEYISSIKKLDCVVVLNEQPPYTGIGNVNLQVLSTLSGLKKAKELGCAFAMKTRTDQRIYKASTCSFLLGLIRTFPSECEDQQGRIVVLQGSTGCMFIPYYIADFFYFGMIDDMLKLFSRKLSDKQFSDRKEMDKFDMELAEKYPIGQALHYCAPQNFIMESYAKQIGFSIDGSVKQYWDFVKKSLICISVSQIDLFWRKYSLNIFENTWSHEFEFGDSEDQLLTYNWTFENWLSLVSGEIKYDSKYEEYKLRKRVM